MARWGLAQTLEASPESAELRARALAELEESGGVEPA